MSTGAGTFELGGDLAVDRLGFGAMRLTRDTPASQRSAHAVLRRAVELGVELIDTADFYGPEVSEELIAEALHPYPDGLVIATKGGATHTSSGGWAPNGRPDHLRRACEASLRRLKLDRIDLYQLHTVDPAVPLQDSVGALAELRAEGKVRHVGLSNVTVDELARAREIVPIVSVQNRYNVADRAAEDVLEACEADGIGFIPWRPLAPGSLAEPGAPLARAAERHRAAPSQLALAWLLQRSPVVLPIPGTSSVEHLEENVAAAKLRLEQHELDELADATRS